MFKFLLLASSISIFFPHLLNPNKRNTLKSESGSAPGSGRSEKAYLRPLEKVDPIPKLIV